MAPASSQMPNAASAVSSSKSQSTTNRTKGGSFDQEVSGIETRTTKIVGRTEAAVLALQSSGLMFLLVRLFDDVDRGCERPTLFTSRGDKVVRAAAAVGRAALHSRTPFSVFSSAELSKRGNFQECRA